MPVVQIDWLEGRDVEKKKRLIKDITNAFKSVGVSKDTLHIIIRDIPKTDWGHKGLPQSELKK